MENISKFKKEAVKFIKNIIVILASKIVTGVFNDNLKLNNKSGDNLQREFIIFNRLFKDDKTTPSGTLKHDGTVK
ncbi:MAG: hypothetical protein AAB705_04075 [Patescibacteria group bacterium]